MDPWLLLPRILLFFDTLLPRERAGSEGVAAVCFGFCARSFLVPETATVSLRNTGLFLSTGNRYLFLLQRRLIPSDSWLLLLIQVSHVQHQSFASGVSDLYIFSLWFSTFACQEPMSSDESPCRTIANTFLSCADSRILNFDRLSKMSSDGFFGIDNRTSSHLVSNSWKLSPRRVTESKST